MEHTRPCRVHHEFKEVLACLTEEINSGRKNGDCISQVEVSKLLANFLQGLKLEDIIERVEKKHSNGNKYNLQAIPKFPGGGMMDI